MRSNSNQQEQIFSSQEQDMECIELRERITIRPLELHNLVNDRERFGGRIMEFIGESLERILTNQKQELKFALVFLKQAEKVLEYAASSGKNINKELIINVLHSQASIYQKLWQLNNCSNYLQGIIYNYKQFIKQTSCQGSLIQGQSQLHPEPSELIFDPIRVRMKQRLARYHLQFCAVNSQLASHDAALSAAKKAQKLIADSLNHSQDQLRKQFGIDFPLQLSTDSRMALILGLSGYQKKLEERGELGEMSKSLLKCAHFTLQGLEDAKSTRTQNVTEKDYLDYLANYSIGNLVEIVPLRVDPGQIGIVSVMKDKGSMIKQRMSVQSQRQFNAHSKIILLSTCFFSRATQLRLKSLQICRKCPDERKLTREYKLSINYHLLAVITVALLLPYELKYLSEILMSYQKHYGSSLLEYKTVQTESLSKIAELLSLDLSPPAAPTPFDQVQVQQIKNDYHMKVNFENDKLRKLEKIKSLKKITKQLTDPKRLEEKDLKMMNKSKDKDSKTSFSITKRQRTLSKNETLKKSPVFKQKQAKHMKEIKQKGLGIGKNTEKIKNKRSPQMIKSRNGDEKKIRSKQIIDETQELFFCFSKKTKKTQGIPPQNSQVRSNSIGSNSGKSKGKKSLLSPRNIKQKPINPPKSPKSPPKRKMPTQTYYY